MEVCEADAVALRGSILMKTIRITRRDHNVLKNHLFNGSGNEEAALLVAGSSIHGGDRELLVREVIPVPSEGLLYQGPCRLGIAPDFMMPVIKRCRCKGLSLIDVHSHPGSGSVGFSGVDDAGDSRLLPKIQQRIPGRDHASIVMNRDSAVARLWRAGEAGPEAVDRIVVVGQPLEEICGMLAVRRELETLTPYARQVLMFGEEGQRLLGQVTVGVVGCGGLGSMLVQQFAHLGIGGTILIDHDYVDETNISRTVGSTAADIGLLKVEVARRHALNINPGMTVEAIPGTVLNEDTALRLLAADIIVCGTDTVASRMILNRLASQYLRPLVDCGIDIKVLPSGKAKVLGRVMTVLPDGPCLSCAGIIDPTAVADELADTALNAGYVQGVPAPSVITLNGVVASLAATEVMDLVVGFKDEGCSGSHLSYCGHKGTIQSGRMRRITKCRTCREIRAAGDGYRLPCTSTTNLPVLDPTGTRAQAFLPAERGET